LVRNEGLIVSEKSKTISNDMENTKERHRKYLRAINNPVRRNILREILKGYNSVEDLIAATGLDYKTLDWHLNILEDGYCIEKYTSRDKVLFTVTQEGKVIEVMDK
jgi:DNA-binding transcriptional ArsR family regulator